MAVYFDASCLYTLTARDGHWIALTAWIATNEPEPLFSDFGVGEVASALGNHVRAGRMASERATASLEELRVELACWPQTLTESSDIAAATRMVADFALSLRLPDAIHLAIARRTGAILLTTDRRQADAAAALGIAYADPTRPA